MATPRIIQSHELLCLLNASNQKIDSIKLIRQLTGYGLKEAKDFIEKEWIPILEGSISSDPQTDKIDELKTRLDRLEKFVMSRWRED